MPLFDSVGQTSDPDRIVSFTTSKAGRKPAADGLVPCPICKVGVKPANLESHKTKCTILERARKKQRAERREELNRRSQEIQEHREEEARHREEEDASTKAEEEGRAQVQARRKSDGRCVMCGNPLGFFQRLLGKDRHGPCTEFRD
jgi:flagellar motility protein MotE (MotC chaperone)